LGIVGERAKEVLTMAQDTEQGPAQSQHEDVMPLMGIDHVEYYVGNARQAA